jgi:hypothetical protein
MKFSGTMKNKNMKDEKNKSKKKKKFKVLFASILN